MIFESILGFLPIIIIIAIAVILLNLLADKEIDEDEPTVEVEKKLFDICPEEWVKWRYAKGEIDKETFSEMMSRL